jgi:hypothetical protein
MRALCLLALFGAVGGAQSLVFTTRVHLACPVLMSAIAQTKDVGFDSVVVRNESKKTIDTIHLSVAMYSESGEDIVERASFIVMLGPGEAKRINVGLGRVQELTAKIKNSRRPVVQAILFVQSADFTDGTLWSGDEPTINDPVRPPPTK